MNNRKGYLLYDLRLLWFKQVPLKGTESVEHIDELSYITEGTLPAVPHGADERPLNPRQLIPTEERNLELSHLIGLETPSSESELVTSGTQSTESDSSVPYSCPAPICSFFVVLASSTTPNAPLCFAR